MTKTIKYIWAFLPFLMLAVTGCVKMVPEKQYWGVDGHMGNKIPHAYARYMFNPDLFVLEFQEDGALWREGAAELVQRRIADLEQPGYLFIYIHGWKYSAHPEDANL